MEDTSRQKILIAATQLFAQKGLDSVSVREIASHACVNLSMISYHFGGKSELYRAIMVSFAKEAQQQLEQIFGSVNEKKVTQKWFRETMKKLIYQMLEMKYSRPELFILLNREATNGLPLARDIYEEMFDALGTRIVEVFQAGQKKGFIKKNLNLYVHFLFLVHATDFFMIAQRCNTRFTKKCYQLPKQLKAFAQQTFETFVEGIMV
jgi:AcrR family transcriptional regulator